MSTKSSATQPKRILFPFGNISVTLSAMEFFVKSLGGPGPDDDVTDAEGFAWCMRGNIAAAAFVRRHIRGDFGDLGEEDIAANILAVNDGSRVVSAYLIGDQKIYVITDAADDAGKRHSTTLMLAEEY